jgi:hypothetical protein
VQILDIGSRIYRSVYAAATLTFTPLFDRAVIVTRLLISNISANDNWTVTVGGREIMRFRLITVGNQALFGAAVLTTNRPHNLMDFSELDMGMSMRIPVPNGLSLVVASVGGATADIAFEGMEVQPADINNGMVNHYQGNKFLMPITGFFNGTAVVGNNQLDTQVAPAWVPPIFTGAELPVNFRVTLLALFLDAQSRNTFSGAADHISREDFMVVNKNGQTLFSRDNIGIPMRPVDAAAGSALNAFNPRTDFWLPFQAQDVTDRNELDPPMVLQGGDLITWSENISGDVTGIAAAAYALSLKVAYCLVEQLI